MASTAAEMVVIITDAIETVVAGGVSAYTIGGIAVTRADLGKLQKLLAYYKGLARPAGSRVRLANIGGA